MIPEKNRDAACSHYGEYGGTSAQYPQARIRETVPEKEMNAPADIQRRSIDDRAEYTETQPGYVVCPNFQGGSATQRCRGKGGDQAIQIDRLGEESVDPGETCAEVAAIGMPGRHEDAHWACLW